MANYAKILKGHSRQEKAFEAKHVRYTTLSAADERAREGGNVARHALRKWTSPSSS